METTEDLEELLSSASNEFLRCSEAAFEFETAPSMAAAVVADDAAAEGGGLSHTFFTESNFIFNSSATEEVPCGTVGCDCCCF